MALRIVEEITVDRPPEAVWAVVTELETHPEWRPSLREFRQVSPGPLQVGARIREVLAWRGREIEVADEVTELEPPQRFGVRGGWAAAAFELELVLAPALAGTTVTFDWTFRPRSLLLRAATPFLRGVLRRETAGELEGLKRFIEARP